MGKTIVMIPCRLESSRLKSKMLLEIAGKPIIKHCYDAVKENTELEVYIAADSKLYPICSEFAKTILTDDDCPGGIHRCYQAFERANLDAENIVIIQGDELIIPDNIVDRLAEGLEEWDIMTAMKVIPYDITPIKDRESLKDVYEAQKAAGTLVNPNITNTSIVKTFPDINNQLHYFTRSDILTYQYLGYGWEVMEHVGMYAYKKETLEKVTKADKSLEEQLHKIELLTALVMGLEIGATEVTGDVLNVNIQADYERALKRFQDGRH